MTTPGVMTQPAFVTTLFFCAALMAWSLARRGQELRRARAVLAASGHFGAWDPGLPARIRAGVSRLTEVVGRKRELLCLPVGCVGGLWGDSFLPPLAAVVAVPLVRRRLEARTRRRARDRRSEAVIELCGAVAGDLRAGRQPGEAVRAFDGAALEPAWAAVPAAARFGGDVPAALRAVGRQEGAEGLAGVAACWQVAVDGGAGLAAGLERVGHALSVERDQREELAAQLAGTRSTAVMLALLPAVALAMGAALGAEPLRVLLHTPAGIGCLALGGLLESAGLAWTRRIVRAAAGGGEGA
ncbi:type II secretion system F family protein [Streptomyces huiliensis]|uniref:type II secretion system F family protein n=1 Tax=Streptomyces huiliensis TaxID=2876027 RepID=UPI001CBF0508|nr:type II secretion system F family protein [Streptomyces huiliensis]MBZ4318210.1 type II secretion system F family protein [Streptomyces huiliensis]